MGGGAVTGELVDVFLVFFKHHPATEAPGPILDFCSETFVRKLLSENF
jgi:hypothetical protein